MTFPALTLSMDSIPAGAERGLRVGVSLSEEVGAGESVARCELSSPSPRGSQLLCCPRWVSECWAQLPAWAPVVLCPRSPSDPPHSGRAELGEPGCLEARPDLGSKSCQQPCLGQIVSDLGGQPRSQVPGRGLPGLADEKTGHPVRCAISDKQ